MSRSVLISLLGRTAGNKGYRPTTYRFSDGSFSEPTSFFGWELSKRKKPDAVILLGTSGSMWDWLATELIGNAQAGGGAEDAAHDGAVLEKLIDAVDGKSVTSALLAECAPVFCRRLQCDVVPLLIPNCQTPEEQHQLLLDLAPHVMTDDRITIDLSHGYRHLALLLMMAALYLRSIRNASIESVFTSFIDEESNQSQVFELKGLLTIIDWQAALSSFSKDGDPGVFVELMEAEGVAQAAIRELSNASYLSRVNSHQKAWQAERTVANQLSQNPPGGISGLFTPFLVERLGRREGVKSSIRLAAMARRQLELGSYDRAVLLGLTAAQAKAVIGEELLDDAHHRLLNESSDYCRLYSIRNSIAHTSDTAKSSEATKSMKSEDSLRTDLNEIFGKLL